MGDQFLWDTVDLLKIMDIWTEKLNAWNTLLVLEFWPTVSAFLLRICIYSLSNIRTKE